MTYSQAKTIEKKIVKISKEMQTMRSLLFSFLLEDKEGAYKSSFVRDIKQKSTKAKKHTFISAHKFLQDLQS